MKDQRGSKKVPAHLPRLRHVAIVGESPELIVPLSEIEELLERAKARSRGRRFYIDARGAQTGVGAEIKRAVMEAIREGGFHVWMLPGGGYGPSGSSGSPVGVLGG